MGSYSGYAVPVDATQVPVYSDEGGQPGNFLLTDNNGLPKWNGGLDPAPASLTASHAASAVLQVIQSGDGRAMTVTSTHATTPTIQITSGGFAIIAAGGHIEVSTVGKGFILKSPDGTRYRIQVANGGVLSTTAA